MKSDIENEAAAITVAEPATPETAEPASTDVKHDEVDFSSGFEKQYQKEYRPAERPIVPPPQKEIIWYRDFTTILLVIFLAGIFVIGSVFLLMQFLTPNPIIIVLIFAVYVIIAIFVIFLEAKSGGLR